MAPLFYPDPPLVGARVRLRPWTSGDRAGLLHACRDPLVQRFRQSLPDDPQGAALWLADTVTGPAAGRRVELAICGRADDAPLGSIGLHTFHHRNRIAEGSYWLGAEGRGRGLATESLRLVCRWGFESLRLRRITLMIETSNHGSQALAQRCGFTCEGRMRERQLLRDGTVADCDIYGLLAKEMSPSE